MNKKTNHLEKFLVDKPWMLNLVFDTIQTQEGNFGASLFYLFHLNDCQDVIIDYSTDYLLKYGGMEYIRGNYPGTFVFVEFAKLYSHFFLKRILTNILEKYLGENVTYSNLDINVLPILDNDQQIFAQFCRELFDSILNSSNQMPIELLTLLKFLTDKLNNENQSDDNQFIVVSTIYFLRVLIPCIIDPIRHEILSKELYISNEGKKSLLFVAKIIQSIVNNTKLEEDNSLSGWLKYFDDYRLKISSFVGKIMMSESSKRYPIQQIQKMQFSEYSKILFENINKYANNIIEAMRKLTTFNSHEVSPSHYADRFSKIINKLRKEFGIKDLLPVTKNSRKTISCSRDFLPDNFILKYQLKTFDATVMKAISLNKDERLKDFMIKLAGRHKINLKEKIQIKYIHNNEEYVINNEESFSNFIQFKGKTLMNITKQKSDENENEKDDLLQIKDFSPKFDIPIFDSISIDVTSKKNKSIDSVRSKPYPKSPSEFKKKDSSEGFKAYSKRMSNLVEEKYSSYNDSFFNSDEGSYFEMSEKPSKSSSKKSSKLPSTPELKKPRQSNFSLFSSEKMKKKKKDKYSSQDFSKKKYSQGDMPRISEIDESNFDESQESPRELSFVEFLKLSSSELTTEEDSIDKNTNRLTMLGKKSFNVLGLGVSDSSSDDKK